MTEPPTTFANSNHRGNDPWDHDAVSWMLDQLGPGSKWTYHNLFECARRQPRRLRTDNERVAQAAAVCVRFGVEQIELVDPRLGKRITRLRRTDSEAPTYPSHYGSIAEPGRLDPRDHDGSVTGLRSTEAGEPVDVDLSGDVGSTLQRYYEKVRGRIRRHRGG